MRLNMESNQPKILVLLDFIKFILKLRQRYGSGTRLLLPRYQKVACGDNVSPLAPLVAGVSQGSPFSVY
jgi:hypothetical protein